MMFVDAKAVETDLLAIFQFVQKPVVQFLTLLGVEMRIRQDHPRGIMFPPIVQVHVRVWHQVKGKDLHLFCLLRISVRLCGYAAVANAFR